MACRPAARGVPRAASSWRRGRGARASSKRSKSWPACRRRSEEGREMKRNVMVMAVLLLAACEGEPPKTAADQAATAPTAVDSEPANEAAQASEAAPVTEARALPASAKPAAAV